MFVQIGNAFVEEYTKVMLWLQIRQLEQQCNENRKSSSPNAVLHLAYLAS